MMTNGDLAEELRALANLLLIAGEDEFKARRYARIADAVDASPEPIETLCDEGRLTSLAGVGEHTAELIRQYLATGTCRERQAAEERVPATALDLLAVPGLGPKTAQRLFQELGVADLDALARALDAGELRTLKGMSERTEAKLSHGLALVRRRNVERPLHEVVRLGEQIGERLQLAPAAEAVAHAGEARRGRELPRSVHLVVATEDIGQAALLLQRVGLGDGRPTPHIRGEFGGGFPIHVRFASPATFGVVWLRDTADREHLDALNERAAQRHLPPLTDDDAWRDLSEEQVYGRLGLPYLPPELREGSAAIAAADRGSLPALLDRDGYRGDLHLHTTESDGRHSLPEMAEAAIARGYEYIAVCDHSRSTRIANGLSADRLLRQIEEVRKLNGALGGRLTVLAGSEVDILKDGSLDFPDSVLAQLDWVVASVHAHFNLPEKQQTERIRRAMENSYVRVIGHPTGRLLGEREAYPVDVPALVEKAAETGVALELNSAPERLDLAAEWCAAARRAGVPLCVNTDAHHRESLDFIQYGLMTARRAWLEARHVVNTWGLARVRSFRAG
jgi:DNA polymerase (family 10)